MANSSNPIIESARAQFAALDLRRIEVAEWGDGTGPLVLFAEPVTLADKKRLSARHTDGGIQEMYVHTLILKAQTADGKPAFTLDDKRALMTAVDPSVVERIAHAILATPSMEDVEKK